jgi:ABC-type branched-subunit amino acid transport system substrate-binding protein
MILAPSSRSRRRAARASLAAASLFTVAACSSSKNSSSPGGSSATSVGVSPSDATLPPPAKVTGTLSGPGVTASTIDIGNIATISGPVPGLFQGADDGLDAWAAWVNANGGIAGHTVKITHTDDAFACNTYTNTMKSYATSQFAVVGNLTLEDTCGKAVLAANPDLLDIQALALDPTLYSIANVYTGTPAPPGGITTGWAYIKSRFPNDITKTASLVGQAAAVNGKETQLTNESLGFKYVYTRVIGNFETNYTSDVLRMKSDGVKIVDMTADNAGHIVDFIKQAHQQGFHPDAVVGAAAYDSTLFSLLGNASLANNLVFAPLPYAMYLGQDAATNPGVATFLTWLQKVHPGDTANLFAVDAWAAGMLFYQAVQNAGPNITRATVASALGNITSFNAGGLVGANNPAQKQGTKCVVVAEVVGGAWKRADPAGGGFDCSGTYFNIPLSKLQS